MNLFKKRADNINRADDPTRDSSRAEIDHALNATANWLRAEDPETSRQWISLANRMSASEAPSLLTRPRVRWAFVMRPAVAIAVVAVVLFAIASLLMRQPEEVRTYATGRGENASVLLSDSSLVTLNHTSELLVHDPDSREARSVALQGEGYFRIRKNSLPFIVTTDVAAVTVLGTEFNVRVRDGSIEVAVLTGTVEVSARNGAKESMVILKAGQITWCRKGGEPGPPEMIVFSEYPGWMHGKILFQRAAVRAVCDEIESKFDCKVLFETARVAEATITGALDTRSAESAVSTLATLTGTRYRHEDNRFTLY